MSPVGFVYDDVFLKHENPYGHPECGDRLTHIVEALKRFGLWNKLIHIPPRQASREDLLRVHTQQHVDSMAKLVGYADPDTYVSPGSHEAALYAAGALLEVIDRIKAGEIDYAFCAVRPPGHHAEADRAMGFCIFNNIAVAARYAQKLGYAKVFIVDFDVHHGNGTQHIFESDQTVYYFSSHQYPHYPGTGAHHERGRGAGEGFTANYEMRPGSGDKEFFGVYHDTLPSLMRQFRPDIVLVSAGYDLLAYDPLSHLRVTGEGLTNIIESILYEAQYPVVFTLEGGYNQPALGEAVALTMGILLKKTGKVLK